MKNQTDGRTPTVEIEAYDLEEQYINSKQQERTRKGILSTRYNPNLDSVFAHISIGGGNLNVSQEMANNLIEAFGEISWEKPKTYTNKGIKKVLPSNPNIVRTSSISDTKTKKQNRPKTKDTMTIEQKIFEQNKQFGKILTTITDRLDTLEGD